MLCAKCHDSSSGLGNCIPMKTTLLTCLKKRRENESFLEWFNQQTNFDSLEYTSSRQKDFLQVFSRRKEADVRVEK